MNKDLVEVQLLSAFNTKPIREGVMSAELVSSINKAFMNESGRSESIFRIKVKKSCQAERQKA